MIEDARAATGIQVRAQEAGPPAHLSASSAEGPTPAQLHAHSAAREAQLSSAQLSGRLSPTLTDEERLQAGRQSPSFSSEFERRLEEDRVQAEEDRRLLHQLNSPTTTPPADEPADEPAAEQRRPPGPAAEQPAPEPAAEHRRPPDALPATMGPPEAEGAWATRFDPDLTDAQMYPAQDDDDDDDDDAEPPPTLVASPPVEPSSPQMLASSSPVC